MAFSPDRNKLASRSVDNTVRVWDVATGQIDYTLEGHSGSVNSVAFSPDESKLASGLDNETVRVWDVATIQVNYTLEGYSDSVNSPFLLVSKNTSDLGAHPGAVQRHTKEYQALSVDQSSQWATQNGLRLLYLPIDHRPGKIAVQNNALAIETDGGRVTIISTCSI